MNRETDVARGIRLHRERAIWHWQIQRWLVRHLPYLWFVMTVLAALWVAAIARAQ